MRIVIILFFLSSWIFNPLDSWAQEFEKIAGIDVGKAPHGMRIKEGHLYLAAAGDDAIEVIDLKTLKIIKRWPVPNTPLDIVPFRDGWLVTLFQGDEVVFLNGSTGAIEKRFNVGAGPSLFIPEPIGSKRYVVSELADKFTVIDGDNTTHYKTGKRPYPADVMADGLLAFIPNRDEDTVSVIDLLNKQEVARVKVCKRPEGGMLTRDQISYVVVCNGENKVAFINTASFEVTNTISDGIGPEPFSITMSPKGRYGFVNNAGGVDVSVIDMKTSKVIARLPAGKQPIVLRMDGNRLYVASEVSNTLSIFEITEPIRNIGTKKNQLFVMGMIHDGHLTSKRYGLEKVEEIIKAYNPDYVIAEIPPNRIEAALKGFKETGVLNEPRTKRFSEYRGVLYPLKKGMDFQIIGGAAWTDPMNNYRNATAKRLADAPAWEDARIAVEKAEAKAEKASNGRDDDPYYINSEEYDRHTKEMLQPYDHYYNDVYGPGGWTNINIAHYALIERALNDLKGEGKRILITYGAGHKYWFLEQLRKRDDIELIELPAILTDQ